MGMEKIMVTRTGRAVRACATLAAATALLLGAAAHSTDTAGAANGPQVTTQAFDDPPGGECCRRGQT
jgi:hypothetical protein